MRETVTMRYLGPAVGKKTDKRHVSTDGDEQLRNNPFAGLGAKLDEVPQASSEAPEHTEPVQSREQEATGLEGKIVVRREKKGRGGKTVTVIEGLAMSPNRLQALVRRMRKALGCGGQTEGSTIVLTGSQTERVQAWLQREGAGRVVIGN